MDTILVFEKEERYQYIIDTSTILNSIQSIKLFVKYIFNEQFDGEINKSTNFVTRNYLKLACFLPELA